MAIIYLIAHLLPLFVVLVMVQRDKFPFKPLIQLPVMNTFVGHLIILLWEDLEHITMICLISVRLINVSSLGIGNWVLA